MNREVDVDYLRACGLSEEQIKVIEEAFACEDANSGQTGEDAIKRLRDILAEATETDNSVCYVTSDDADALKAAIEAIEQEGKPKWISVSEDLPKDAYGCIVTVMDVDLKTQNEFENILPYFVGYDGETWNNADGEPIPYEVIAWMKAPGPYKAERGKE